MSISYRIKELESLLITQIYFLHLFKMNQLVKGLANTFSKEQIVEILDFAGHLVCCNCLTPLL